jgi:hypothetical protein
MDQPMKKAFFYFLTVLVFFSCNEQSGKKETEAKTAGNENNGMGTDMISNMDNLLAWCIVPFDSMHRTPSERIAMLKDLGFTGYAYDWRIENLDEMAGEFRLARDNGIEVNAVWLWIDAHADRIGKLSDTNERMLRIVRESGLKTEIWTGFHPNFFGGLSEEEAVNKGIKMIGYLAERADSIGCRLALYNHGDWFGDPLNQVKIIQGIPDREIGIVYNFHHAHDQVERLPELIEAMKPYLWVVNLNGMRVEGPKILPIGSGNLEKEMIEMFLDAGFSGPFGILGHIEDADVKVILQNNLAGFKTLYP